MLKKFLKLSFFLIRVSTSPTSKHNIKHAMHFHLQLTLLARNHSINPLYGVFLPGGLAGGVGKRILKTPNNQSIMKKKKKKKNSVLAGWVEDPVILRK